MIAAVPNIMGWLAISLARVRMALRVSVYFHSLSSQMTTSALMAVDVYFALQDTSFLYMGRLLEGFGVGVISYVVSLIKLHAWLLRIL
jgi:MFS transporter, SP family, ERD6-like sugar transporter